MIRASGKISGKASSSKKEAIYNMSLAEVEEKTRELWERAALLANGVPAPQKKSGEIRIYGLAFEEERTRRLWNEIDRCMKKYKDISRKGK